MSKASDVAGALRRLQQYVGGKTPQPGMFSTLDEAIADAPFDVNSADQWARYLTPGRMVKREGIQFPLKKEELHSTGLIDELNLHGGSQTFTKDELRAIVGEGRPTFRVDVGKEQYDDIGQHAVDIDDDMIVPRAWDETFKHSEIDPRSGNVSDMDRINIIDPKFGEEYGGTGRYHHTSPNSIYEESFTKMDGLVAPTHHTGDTLSWSRTSSHDMFRPTVEDPAGNYRVRLVEEIQADVHRKAAQKLWRDPKSGELFTSREAAEAKTSWDPDDIEEAGRVGYRTDDTTLEIAALRETAEKLDAKLRNMSPITPGGNYSKRYSNMEAKYAETVNELDRLEMKMHDAPHKKPQEYAQLELRKQLMNAADEGEDYLALVRGKDQIERYKDVELLTDKKQASMNRMYDEIYAGELRKLAKRYGATIEDIELEVRTTADIRPETMRDLEIEHPDEYFNDVITEMKKADDPGVIETDVDFLSDMVDEVKKAHREQVGEAFNAEPLDNLLNRLDKIRADAKRLAGEAENVGQRMEYLNNVVQKTREVRDEFAAHWSEYRSVMRADDPTRTVVKSFPAIKLTPEVREKIIRIGVPQYQFGGQVRASDYKKEYIPTEGSLLEMSDEQFARYQELSSILSGTEEQQEVMEQLEEAEKEEEAWGNVPARVWAMMKSNWKTLDPETGEAVWRFPGAPIPYEAVAYGDMDQADWNAMNEQIMAQNYPNIIDELLALPGLPGMLTTDPETGESAIPIPEFSRQAEERVGKLRASVREQAGLPKPEGKIDLGSEMAGIMLGQLPIPGMKGAKPKKPPPATGFHAAGRMAKAVATFPFKAGIEFFNPTIVPRLSTYGMGTAFGVAVGMGMSDDEDLQELPPVQEHRNKLIHAENEEILQQVWPEWSMDEKVNQMNSQAGPLFWAYLTPEQQEEMMEEFEARGMLVEDVEPVGLSKGGDVAKALLKLREAGERILKERVANRKQGIDEWTRDYSQDLTDITGIDDPFAREGEGVILGRRNEDIPEGYYPEDEVAAEMRRLYTAIDDIGPRSGTVAGRRLIEEFPEDADLGELLELSRRVRDVEDIEWEHNVEVAQAKRAEEELARWGEEGIEGREGQALELTRKVIFNNEKRIMDEMRAMADEANRSPEMFRMITEGDSFFDPIINAPRGGEELSEFYGTFGNFGPEVDMVGSLWKNALGDEFKYQRIVRRLKQIEKEGL